MFPQPQTHSQDATHRSLELQFTAAFLTRCGLAGKQLRNFHLVSVILHEFCIMYVPAYPCRRKTYAANVTGVVDGNVGN